MKEGQRGGDKKTGKEKKQDENCQSDTVSACLFIRASGVLLVC